MRLYKYVFERLSISRNSKILEVASGQGLGCAMLVDRASPQQVIGLDKTKEQTERSNLRHAAMAQKSSQLRFVTGEAEDIPFPNQAFTHLFSVEAAQHFSFPKFLLEAHRVLEPDGVLLLTTFFPATFESADKLKLLIPNFNVTMNAFPISQIEDFLYQTHFQDIEICSIGDAVWEGLDAWLSQESKLKNQWSRIWLKAYQHNLLDYYVVRAKTSRQSFP